MSETPQNARRESVIAFLRDVINSDVYEIRYRLKAVEMLIMMGEV